MTEEEVRERLRAAIGKAGGQRRFAEAHGFSIAYVNDVVRGRRELADRILAVLGIERTVTQHVEYREKPQDQGEK